METIQIHDCTIVASQVNSKVVDDRKRKVYGREVTVGIQIQVDSWDARGNLPCLEVIATQKLQDIHPSLTASFGSWFSGPGAYHSWLVASAFVKAEKPSKTLGQKECFLELQTTSDDLQEVLVEAVKEARGNKAAEDAAKARAFAANHILEQITDEIVKEAKANCRFEQRLAALVAEFEAEKKTLLPGKVKELKDDAYYDSGKPIDPKVVKAVCETLPDYISGKGDPQKSTPFFGGGKLPISPEHVH